MARKDTIQDFPLEQDIAPGYAKWILCFMTFLLGLSLVGAVSMGMPFRQGIIPNSNIRMTVEVPQTKDTTAIATIVQSLRVIPGVEKVTPIDSLMLTQLLEPWIGNAELLKDIDVPTLIDIDVRPDAQLTPTELTQFLRTYGAGIRVEAHGPWRQSVVLFQSLFQLILYAVVLLTIGIVLSTVILVTRNSVRVFDKQMNLLHHLGVSASYMARQFLTRLTAMGMWGGIIGFVVSVPTIFGLRWAMGSLRIPSTYGFVDDADVIAILIASPVIIITLSVLTARSILARIIRQMDYS